jgi:hypothetical protein
MENNDLAENVALTIIIGALLFFLYFITTIKKEDNYKINAKIENIIKKDLYFGDKIVLLNVSYEKGFIREGYNNKEFEFPLEDYDMLEKAFIEKKEIEINLVETTTFMHWTIYPALIAIPLMMFIPAIPQAICAKNTEHSKTCVKVKEGNNLIFSKNCYSKKHTTALEI